jgi:hypothetical protein
MTASDKTCQRESFASTGLEDQPDAEVQFERVSNLRAITLRFTGIDPRII